MKLILTTINLAGLALKNTTRNRTRSFLTLMGIATGMFLFTTIETIQDALHNATVTHSEDTTLVVYRENRFCPATSRLPEHYKSEIESIKGVKSVNPIQIMVNNCGTSLDVIVFRGVQPQIITGNSSNIKILEGSTEDWMQKQDGALIGKNLANRRNLNLGDKFDAAGITVQVCGIVEAEDSAQNDNVAFVHLSFLQLASKIGLGIVTQFDVKVTDSSSLKIVANAIDERFATDIEPTSTLPEKAFFASTAIELIELIHFTRWIGLACVVAVIALVSNTILLTVRGKISEHAVLKTLGFNRICIAWMILAESIFLSFGGGLTGIFSAFYFLHTQSISIGNEGLVLAFIPSQSVIVVGMLTAVSLGLVAGLYPAWQGSRYSITESLNSA